MRINILKGTRARKTTGRLSLMLQRRLGHRFSFRSLLLLCHSCLYLRWKRRRGGRLSTPPFSTKNSLPRSFFVLCSFLPGGGGGFFFFIPPNKKKFCC